MRLVMESAIYQLHGLDAKLQHIIDLHGLQRVERLAIPPPDERAIVRGLHTDQLIEVLSSGMNLSGGLGARELRRITADRLHLYFEYIRDIDDERRLHRVLSIGERIQHFEGAVRVAALARCVVRETGQIAGV